MCWVWGILRVTTQCVCPFCSPCKQCRSFLSAGCLAAKIKYYEMTKHKFHQSIYFEDNNGNRLFLFQLINFGVSTDELKFSFTYPKSGAGVVYSEDSTFTDPTDIVSRVSEITYHNDGSFLHKFPAEFEQSSPIYKNPFGKGARRTPLNKLTHWEAIIAYTVVNYSICRKPFTDDSFIVPYDCNLFAGEPFECLICIGNSSNLLLIPDPGENSVSRINNIGEQIDLMLIFTKTSYCGQEIQIPNGNMRFLAKLNSIQIVNKRSERSKIERSLMLTIKLGNFGCITNTELIGNNDPTRGIGIDFQKLQNYPSGLGPSSWVWVIPTTNQFLPPDVLALLNRVRQNQTQSINVSLQGTPLPFNFVASIGNAGPGNDFGFTGEVIIIYKT